LKFKIIFILFNIVVVFSFLIVTLMPFFMLGGEYSLQFFKDSWYFFLVFLITIGIIDSYFFLNWKMFSLLESGEWDDLIIHLENRIYVKKKISLRLLKILLNTYLIKSNIEGITKLEAFLRHEKPELIKKIIIPLSVPFFIDRKPGKMEEFFREFISQKGVARISWVKFLYAYSLILNNKRDEASDILIDLCNIKLSPILKLMVIYSLNPFFDINLKDKFSCIELNKNELSSKYKKERMENELESLNDMVLLLLLAKFSKEAIEWLYKE